MSRQYLGATNNDGRVKAREQITVNKMLDGARGRCCRHTVAVHPTSRDNTPKAILISQHYLVLIVTWRNCILNMVNI